jgi:hypothetical protein
VGEDLADKPRMPPFCHQRDGNLGDNCIRFMLIPFYREPD